MYTASNDTSGVAGLRGDISIVNVAFLSNHVSGPARQPLDGLALAAFQGEFSHTVDKVHVSVSTVDGRIGERYREGELRTLNRCVAIDRLCYGQITDSLIREYSRFICCQIAVRILGNGLLPSSLRLLFYRVVVTIRKILQRKDAFSISCRNRKLINTWTAVYRSSAVFGKIQGFQCNGFGLCKYIEIIMYRVRFVIDPEICLV